MVVTHGYSANPLPRHLRLPRERRPVGRPQARGNRIHGERSPPPYRSPVRNRFPQGRWTDYAGGAACVNKRFFCRIAKCLKSLQGIFDNGKSRPGSDWFYPHFVGGVVTAFGKIAVFTAEHSREGAAWVLVSPLRAMPSVRHQCDRLRRPANPRAWPCTLRCRQARARCDPSAFR
jgi:hypothetical protein